MKTLLFTLEYPPCRGGVANYYGNLVKYWPEPGQICVLHNNNGRLINRNLPLLKWLPALWRLGALVKKNKIEHVLVGQILPLGTAALICASLLKIKYSVILHGMDFAFAVKNLRKKRLSGKILNRAEKIICANSYVENLVKNFLPHSSRGKIIKVNPGIEPNFQFPISNFQLKNKYNLQNKIILLSVGRLVKRKGFDKVVEAMPRVLEKIPNLVYVILGDGEELENYKLQITNYKLNAYVKILNQAGDEERDAWYAASDIFIMPSRNINGDFEGFGLVYLEANLAGKPVIAGDSGGVRDAVEDGVNGLLVNPESTDQIADAIVKLAQNSELREKLGRQGRERAIKEFNWEKQINKIFNFL